MSTPTVVSVMASSPAEKAGLMPGDEVRSISGVVPRDIIEYQLLVEGAEVELEISRGGIELTISVHKLNGEPLGAEISSALFDRVRTCDNHCEFCFIYQLPKGMRKSLYLKDDDYRLSFLYGNFTTLTRFTEADFERVVSERLSPLFVSIHTTNPSLRAGILRNKRGALSLRWLSAMLEAGIEVHGQVVLCPGINDGEELRRTLGDIAIRYRGLSSVGVVPLGISRYSNEARMRAMTKQEAQQSIDIISEFQELFQSTIGRRMVFASDEMYLLAGREFPTLESYEGFPQHENGIGVYRAFEASYFGDDSYAWGRRSGFFDSVDGAPAEGYRPIRHRGPNLLGEHHSGDLAILTSPLGAQALTQLLSGTDAADVRIIEVENAFFGGNIGVAGLMCGADVASVLEGQPEGDRYLLPDVCLNEGRFLDGLTIADLPRPVHVIPTDGSSLRRAISGRKLLRSSS